MQKKYHQNRSRKFEKKKAQILIRKSWYTFQMILSKKKYNKIRLNNFFSEFFLSFPQNLLKRMQIRV